MTPRVRLAVTMTAFSGADLLRAVTPDDIAREYARRHLGRFSHYIDPAYLHGQHLTRLDEALMRVERRELRRLIVPMPPRFGKSLKVSRHFPCWSMGRNPAVQIVQAGYASSIALEHSRGARDIFRSQQFRRVFPHANVASMDRRIIETQDRDAVHEWSTKQGGRYYAVGVRGGLTGRGFDIGIIDDPFKDRESADSPANREAVWNWYKSTFYTRRAPDAAIVIVMARWHPDDLVGRLLREQVSGGTDQWEVLHLKPFNDAGESVWPERWSTQALLDTKATLGEREWAALYEGTPQPAGGAIFKQHWFRGERRYTQQPRVQNDAVGRYQSWDTAEDTDETAAFSSCCEGELTPEYKLRLTHVERDKLAFPDLCRAIVKRAEAGNYDGKLRRVLIEKKSTGGPAAAQLMSTGPEWLRPLIQTVTPRGSKVQRANSASAWCDLGMVLMPRPSGDVPWLHEFETELFSFPGSQNKDQVDSFTQLIWYCHNFLAEGAGINLAP